MAVTEWLSYTPDAPKSELEAHLQVLKSHAHSADDWTHLLGLTALLALGAATPEQCAERNALLDRAMQQPEQFTFPEELQTETKQTAFIGQMPDLMRHIFLHQPGEPLVRPEWLEPGSETAPALCSPPREFYALAAQVLDPEGETPLAQWRNPKSS